MAAVPRGRRATLPRGPGLPDSNGQRQPRPRLRADGPGHGRPHRTRAVQRPQPRVSHPGEQAGLPSASALERGDRPLLAMALTAVRCGTSALFGLPTEEQAGRRPPPCLPAHTGGCRPDEAKKLVASLSRRELRQLSKVGAGATIAPTEIEWVAAAWVHLLGEHCAPPRPGGDGGPLLADQGARPANGRSGGLGGRRGDADPFPEVLGMVPFYLSDAFEHERAALDQGAHTP